MVCGYFPVCFPPTQIVNLTLASGVGVNSLISPFVFVSLLLTRTHEATFSPVTRNGVLVAGFSIPRLSAGRRVRFFSFSHELRDGLDVWEAFSAR